ncbi:MAG: oligosaccharide flippase family protein [Solirubrobacterales bacterium]|nr:oligosaccharide flippase family protein [Solirubrobacterales bacterium]
MSGATPSERHIARSTLAQQASQGVGVVAMLVVITLLGRELSLREFGLFGLLIALASYMLVLQASVEGAAVRAIALVPQGGPPRDRVFSTVLALYAVFGLLAGVIIALVGIALVGVLKIDADLEQTAREGFLALGAVTAVGWPFRAYQDALRGSQQFVAAAIAEVVANVGYVVAMCVLIVAGAPLWVIIAVGGSLPILLGVGSLLLLKIVRAPFRFRASEVNRATAREVLGFSAYLSAIGIADLIVYSSDRIVLSAFRSTAVVGLFEAVIRPHALVRQLHGTLVVTIVPVASGFVATGDEERLHDLLLRGTRYVLAVVVPVTVVLMIVSAPLLDAWLGPEFREAAPAMAILLSYWVVSSATGVGGAMLVARGRAKELTQVAWAAAVLNLTLSVALTPWLGLEGVALGTTIPYLVLYPFVMRLILRDFPVGFGRLARAALLPAYVTATATTIAVGAVRLLAEPEGVLPVVLTATGGLVFAFAFYAVVWLTPAERAMLRAVARREPRT